MSSVRRIVATATAATALSLTGPWAHAAPVAGDERLGTWVALGVALLVAVVAGAVAAAGPAARPAPAARRTLPVTPPAAGPAAPAAPPRRHEEETPTAVRRYAFNDDDTMVQRALADEVRARRAHTAHRPRPDRPDAEPR